MGYATDAVVVGAGVVGLAIARALARAGLETVVLERGPRIGEETSSRNSGVIHAGIYYPPGSMKARLCLMGRHLLYAFCESHGVATRRCGKVVVAVTPAERCALAAIKTRAERCGVNDLRELDRGELREMEPAVEGDCALHSPSTGVVDAHGLMLALQGELESAGGVVALNSPLEAGRLSREGRHVLEVGGASPTTLQCRILVNSGGLGARQIGLNLMTPSTRHELPRQYLAKGHYYAYSGVSPFSRLVYPVPEPGGLGVHATVDIAGALRFGPDVRWVDAIDYSFDDSSRDRFSAAIRRWYPGLDEARMHPDYTGIRPKISGPGADAADFAILGEADHGIPGFCSLHGIESPGLTASLAIAGQVREMLTATRTDWSAE